MISGVVGDSSLASLIVGGGASIGPVVYHDNFYQGTFKVEILEGYIILDKLLFKTNRPNTWRRLNFTADIPSGTSLKFSILDADDDVIVEDIPNGYDICNDVGSYTGNLKIKAELTGTNVSPKLYDVSVGYKPARLGDWTGDRIAEFIENLNNVFVENITNDKFFSPVSSAIINTTTNEVSLK